MAKKRAFGQPQRRFGSTTALDSVSLSGQRSFTLEVGKLVRRFLVPSIGITIITWLRTGALISPRAEVELSPRLHIGRKTQVSSFTKIKDAGGPLQIGQRCSISTGCIIGSGAGGTYIGDDCLIGPNCSILGNTYRYDALDVPFAQQGHESKGTVIGNNVFIGANCVIVDGAHIEDNVMVGAHSLISGRIPKNSVVQGNPAKVLFTRR